MNRQFIHTNFKNRATKIRSEGRRACTFGGDLSSSQRERDGRPVGVQEEVADAEDATTPPMPPAAGTSGAPNTRDERPDGEAPPTGALASANPLEQHQHQQAAADPEQRRRTKSHPSRRSPSVHSPAHRGKTESKSMPHTKSMASNRSWSFYP